MPARRKGRTKQSIVKSSGSSSEDSDLKKTRDIINKLSVKYKKKNEKKSPNENKNVLGYDGDSEPSAESSALSDTADKMSMDEYEFNEPDSPSTALGTTRGNKKKKQSKKATKKDLKTDQENIDAKSKQNKGKTPKTFNVDSESLESSNNENLGESGIEISYNLSSESGSRIKFMQRSSINMSSRACKRLASDMKDVSFTPQPFKLARFMTKDTSTPSNATRTTSNMVQDDCFGFDSLESPAPMLSPVRRVITPMSDYGSVTPSGFDMSSQRSQSSKSSSQSQLDSLKGDLDPSDLKQNKAKKLKKNKGHYKQWIQEKSTEFSEIENFELCIE